MVKQDYNKIDSVYLEVDSDIIIFVDKNGKPFHTMEYRECIDLVYKDKDFAEKVKPFWT